jgi:adenosylcobyric acid synthase
VIGTSIHGAFDASRFRRHFLNEIRERKGLTSLPVINDEAPRHLRERAYDRFAQVLRENLDLSALADLVGVAVERLRN